MGTIIVLAVVGLAVFGAIRSMRKSHDEGGCCGCSHCGTASCDHEHEHEHSHGHSH